MNSLLLNNAKKIKKLDSQNMLSSIEMLPKQMKAVIEDYKKIKLPCWKNIENIVVCGMGGSALGAHIIKSLYFNEIKQPIEIVNGYRLPGFANKKTLCIISSYSGNTEEPIICLKEAQKKTKIVFAISSGGKLGGLIKRKKINGYLFNPKFNPCGEPRMGLGYSFFAKLLLFKKLKLINLPDQKIKTIPNTLNKKIKQFNIASSNNFAKKIARELKKFIPIIIASDFLEGSAHTFANQINENAKNMAAYFILPEANHHLMEGLQFPYSKNNLKFLFIKSNLYHPRTQIRYNITEKVLKKNKIKYIFYECEGSDKISQITEVLALSSFASYYMALLNKINPSLIPIVDYFKNELRKIKNI